jgi:flagellar biosynthetic protein FliR
MSITLTDQTVLIAFWIAFTRWTCIMFQLPIFDNVAIPSIVKVLASLVVTYAFFPIVEPTVVAEVTALGPSAFWSLTLIHALIGLLIGFLVKSIMSIFIASGSLMTQQIGFTSMAYFDPTYEQQIGPFEKMIQWTILIVILSSGALIPMFKGVLTSFDQINYFNLTKLNMAGSFYLDFFKSIFMSSIMLASPILFTNFLINLVMGVVARTVPQMNILMVSFAVNIGLGLLVFFAVSEEFFQVAYNFYIEKLGNWFQFIS